MRRAQTLGLSGDQRQKKIKSIKEDMMNLCEKIVKDKTVRVRHKSVIEIKD